MAAENPETVAAPSNNGVVGAGHPNGTFVAYPNDPITYSPNGKGPVQGVPGGSSHWDYGGNPLAHANTGESARFAPFAGYLQPGLYKPPKSGIANPAPFGLMGFTFTTFLLSLINFSAHGVTTPNIVVGPAFEYGGLVQLLAGMWEMAAGNTFGAIALGSYGGFWISFAIVLTPGGFDIAAQYENPVDFNYALGLFLFGWFIITFLFWILTLRSTVVFCLLFFWLWITFLMLALSYIVTSNVTGGVPNAKLQKAGAMFGLLAAFFAWYVALAGIADDSNSFFTIPVWHFPWSDKGREAREKRDKLKV